MSTPMVVVVMIVVVVVRRVVGVVHDGRHWHVTQVSETTIWRLLIRALLKILKAIKIIDALGLEHDQKFFTMTNLNNWTWPKNMTITNINFTQKICWWGLIGQVPQSRLASSPCLGHLPSLNSPVTSLLYKKKTLGTEVRRTPDLRLRFVGFNFGHVQLLMFIVVMIWSSWFGHVSIPPLS